MYKSYSMELAGRTLTVDIGRVAKQANGAALMHYGDTVVLSTATASDKPREGIDFFPLSVEYNEKLYAVGKIPGGFNKREGKASENAVLTCRVIDRPMRPLFPKDYRNDVTLENLVLSVEQDCSPELTAMLGSAIATAISDIPFDGPTASTQVGLVDGELVFNPTAEQKEKSDLALTVASTREKVIMIEAGANEVPEAKMLEAIFAAHEVNQKVIAFIDQIVAECGKPKHDYVSFAVPEELFEAIQKIVTPEEMEVAVFTDDKQTREENIRKITEKLEEAFADNEEWLAKLGEAVYQYQKKVVRKMILKDHKRPDGRGITEIRPLAAEIDILPRVHGSGMFTRGQTQILNACTLAPLSEAQKIDGLDANETTKRYMHHYNFPSFSVGETKPSRGPGSHFRYERHSHILLWQEKHRLLWSAEGMDELCPACDRRKRQCGIYRVYPSGCQRYAEQPQRNHENHHCGRIHCSVSGGYHGLCLCTDPDRAYSGVDQRGEEYGGREAEPESESPQQRRNRSAHQQFQLHGGGTSKDHVGNFQREKPYGNHFA